MPMPRTTQRKQRFKKTVNPTSDLVSAAVSIDANLYRTALSAAEGSFEGNFSRYVRHLIRRDLGKTQAA